jgi:glycosyltransferase involved in cell wall biosynthesis
MKVDLLYFPTPKQSGVQWPLGNILVLPDTPQTIAPVVDAWIQKTTSDYGLFWDMKLGLPDPDVIQQTIGLSGDIWHAGLKMGMGGLPKMIDFVNSTWMLNRDPDPDILATSWRMSLRASLIRTDVLKQLGGIDSKFDTLDGAGLDMGHRYITRGAFVRHAPILFSGKYESHNSLPSLTVYDELRFIEQHYGQRWLTWSLWRSVFNGYPILRLIRAYLRLRSDGVQAIPPPYKRSTLPDNHFNLNEWHDKVTILIPTLERYPYLRNELKQLNNQTVRPREIIIIDQTPPEERNTNLAIEFQDLPLRIFYQNIFGQCTAWNEGLMASTGEFVLFLGDDADQISPTFLEDFLRTFMAYQADMVASVVEEVGAGPPPPSCTFLRISDIFPITMVRRDLLQKTGLMDYAYDRGIRADGDLGMRCYLSGALMVLNPDIRLLHHRAPTGGLRKHKARVVTYSSSRRSLIQRHLPSTTEIYLTKRYYNPHQVWEMLWLQTLGTFSIRAGIFKNIAKSIISLFFLPNTLWHIGKNYRQAVCMMRDFPKIPMLDSLEHPEDDSRLGSHVHE